MEETKEDKTVYVVTEVDFYGEHEVSHVLGTFSTEAAAREFALEKMKQCVIDNGYSVDEGDIIDYEALSITSIGNDRVWNIIPQTVKD